MALSSPGTVAAPAARSVTEGLTGRGFSVKAKLVEVLLITMLLLTILVLFTLILDVVIRGSSVWAERPWDFLTAGLNGQNAAVTGVGQAIFGTVMLCVIVAVVSFPLGIACAVYLEEYAADSKFAKLVQINVRNLAGVPSIVYGLLGLAIFVNLLNQLGGSDWNGGRNLIAGGLALSALVLPIVVITTSEALRAVPRSIREGALGVGATEWETIRSHVLPSASPGILTGTVLSLARAAGEAAPVLLVGAITGLLASGNQGFLDRLGGPFTALPVAIYSFARQPGEDFRSTTAAASLVLIVLVLLMNGIAIWLRNRYEKKW